MSIYPTWKCTGIKFHLVDVYLFLLPGSLNFSHSFEHEWGERDRRLNMWTVGAVLVRGSSETHRYRVARVIQKKPGCGVLGFWWKLIRDDLWPVVAKKTTTIEMNPKRNLMLDILFAQSRSSPNFVMVSTYQERWWCSSSCDMSFVTTHSCIPSHFPMRYRRFPRRYRNLVTAWHLIVLKSEYTLWYWVTTPVARTAWPSGWVGNTLGRRKSCTLMSSRN